MAQSWLLLGVLAWASRCCGAFHVDHYDEQRRLTRVAYNPWVQAKEVSVHYNTQPGRRLDWHDGGGPGSPGYTPNQERPDFTMMVVNPDELYFHRTDTAIVIYGTDIELDEYMWDATLDLVVVGGRIHLPASMKFVSKPEWTGGLRMVHLQAMEVVVPDGGATIDVCGDTGLVADNGLSAAHGVDPGDDGRDGRDGGSGGPGGVVEIKAGAFKGGALTIHVDGGAGGAGQNGGDGAVGAVGDRRTDIDDCCKGKDQTGQTGNPGGDGGAGGFGGNGGNGGTAGYVNIAIQKPIGEVEDATNLEPDGSIKNVLVSSQGGVAGAPGTPGREGIGGMGGPGIMTKCKRIDIFWFNRMCTFPIGEAGVHGGVGPVGEAGAPGKMGAFSDSGMSTTEEMNLTALRAKGSNGDNLRYELFYADKLYRSGSYAEAMKLYLWIEAVINSPHSDAEEGTQNVPWAQIGLQAATRITQLRSDLDFWGHQLNHAPLLSFQALHDNVLNLLDIAGEAEKAFDKYYEEETTETMRKSLIVKAMKNIDYQISATNSGLHQAKESIQQLRTDILQFQVEQDTWTALVMEHAEACDSAIADHEAGVNSGLIPTVRKLTTLATNGWALWGTVAATVGVGLGIWGLLSSQVQPLVETVMNSVTRPDNTLQAVLDVTLDDSVPRVQTIIADTLTSRTDVEGEWEKIVGAIDTIQADATSDQTRVNDIRTRTTLAVSLDDFLTIRSEYIDEIEECGPVRDNYGSLRSVSVNMMNKIREHDATVLQFAVLSVERSTLATERTNLMHSVIGTFDPTSLQFMQSIGQAYRGQKDRIVESLKMLHDAVDFEFCDQNPFQYEDVRVAQLASFLAKISSDRLRRLSEDTASRGVLQETLANGQVSAVTQISLTPSTDAALTEAFDQFWSNGTLIFNIDMTNAALPAGVANLRVVSAQAFVPALLLDQSGTNDRAEVWMRKLGSSTCTNPAGKELLFSHAASSYYSVYSAKVDPRVTDQSPTWMTQPSHSADVVGPTPFGTWQLSVPALQTPIARAAVKEVVVHLFLSYVPCNEAGCGSSGSAQGATSLSVHSKHNQFDQHSLPSASTATSLSLVGAALIGSLLTISAVFGLDRRAARRATPAIPRTDTELHSQ